MPGDWHSYRDQISPPPRFPVDVDDRYFPYGIPITPATFVEISGEIDKEFMSSPEVDVKKMIVVLPSDKDTLPSSGFQETE